MSYPLTTSFIHDHETSSNSKTDYILYIQNTLFLTYVDSDTFIFDLMNFLGSKLQSHWFEFGYHLKVPLKELHRLEVTVGQDSTRCTRQLLFIWKNLNPAASWEPIAEALDKSGLFLLSVLVTKRYKNPNPIFYQTHGTDFNNIDVYDVPDSLPNSMSVNTFIYLKDRGVIIFMLQSM